MSLEKILPSRLTRRSRIAAICGRAAGNASRLLGRGSGGMIGGKVALTISPDLLAEISRGYETIMVTGTNGKSTTTRMLRAAFSTLGHVASNTNGDNMPPGVATAYMGDPAARFAVLEVDEMHFPHVAEKVDPAVLVLLNLSRDQLDRVGEIGTVEKRLREAADAHPNATIIANCDDPLIASAAWDHPHVIWVAAGTGWGGDSVGFPRGGRVVRSNGSWHVVGASKKYSRPEPDWWYENVDRESESGASADICSKEGIRSHLTLKLPGEANLGNATQAVAAAVNQGIDLDSAVEAINGVREVAGRYSRYNVRGRIVHLMLAKNPAGWQEALSMIPSDATQVMVAVNGQIADGQDLSWLWDVDFSQLKAVTNRRIIISGERSADLTVRVEYAGVNCRRVPSAISAIAAMNPGDVEVLANYTAFRDLKRALDIHAQVEPQREISNE